MAKQLVQFLRTHGAYVKGDKAGFSEAVADNFANAKPPIAKKLGPVTRKAPAADPAAQDREEAEAARVADLDAREAALIEREREIKAKEAAAQGAEKTDGDDGEAQKGKPPAQGAKAK